MVDEEILWQIAVGLGVICVLSLLLITGHAIWLVQARRHTRKHLARGRAALNSLISTGELSDEDQAVIRTMPAYVRNRLFVELSPTFGGGVRDRLREIAEEVGAVRYAESLLQSRAWWRRLRGVRLLAALGASETLVLAQLRDPSPAVRAQVAEWAAEHASPGILTALLEMLSTGGTLYRFTVQDTLLRLRQAAVEPIAQYLELHRGLEVVPVLQVAANVAHPLFGPPSVSLARSPEPEVRTGAAEVLGAVGGGDAAAVLSELLSDPEAPVRAAAAQGLAKLRHWPAVASLAPLLRDSAWEVRRAAGLALRDLGSPGILFLRRYLDDTDRFAADMARQVLDLPSASEGRFS